MASRLHVEYQEGDLIMPGDQLGLGTQSAIVAGIFEALRQRYCHRILTELAAWEDYQTIYSTHSSTAPTLHDLDPFVCYARARQGAAVGCVRPYGSDRMDQVAAVGSPCG